MQIDFCLPFEKRSTLKRKISFVEIDHEILSTVIFSLLLNQEILSTVIFSLLLNQEGQLSVSGESMCTILVNRLED